MNPNAAEIYNLYYFEVYDLNARDFIVPSNRTYTAFLTAMETAQLHYPHARSFKFYTARVPEELRGVANITKDNIDPWIQIMQIQGLGIARFRRDM